MPIDNETKEFRLEYLRGKLDQEITFEDLLDQSFPQSVLHSAYWSSAAPGGRLAFELGARVFFSTKFGYIKLIPMTWNEQRTAQRRIDLQRKRANEKNAEAREIINEIRAARQRRLDHANHPTPPNEGSGEISSGNDETISGTT